MSQRNVTKLEKPAVKRTLRRFWEVTRMKPAPRRSPCSPPSPTWRSSSS